MDATNCVNESFRPANQHVTCAAPNDSLTASFFRAEIFAARSPVLSTECTIIALKLGTPNNFEIISFQPEGSPLSDIGRRQLAMYPGVWKAVPI
jgi:hypothetical protein